jgi:hypothetical protein
MTSPQKTGMPGKIEKTRKAKLRAAYTSWRKQKDGTRLLKTGKKTGRKR